MPFPTPEVNGHLGAFALGAASVNSSAPASLGGGFIQVDKWMVLDMGWI